MYYSIKTKGRNIRAFSTFYSYVNGFPSGAFNNKIKRERAIMGGETEDLNYCELWLDANINSTVGIETQNPMAGHANGDDIHPYSIYLVPLISY